MCFGNLSITARFLMLTQWMRAWPDLCPSPRWHSDISFFTTNLFEGFNPCFSVVHQKLIFNLFVLYSSLQHLNCALLSSGKVFLVSLYLVCCRLQILLPWAEFVLQQWLLYTSVSHRNAHGIPGGPTICESSLGGQLVSDEWGPHCSSPAQIRNYDKPFWGTPSDSV